MSGSGGRAPVPVRNPVTSALTRSALAPTAMRPRSSRPSASAGTTVAARTASQIVGLASGTGLDAPMSDRRAWP